MCHLREIAIVCGSDTADLIYQRFAGRRVLVPTQYRSHHPLLLPLGESAVSLVFNFGGLQFRVPMSRYKILTDDEIRSAIQSGLSINQLAIELNRSRWTISRRKALVFGLNNDNY